MGVAFKDIAVIKMIKGAEMSQTNWQEGERERERELARKKHCEDLRGVFCTGGITVVGSSLFRSTPVQGATLGVSIMWLSCRKMYLCPNPDD